MKVVVTGGAGYIGSVTVDALVEQGAQVVVFDNLSTGHRAAVNRNATLVVGDLRDEPAIDAVLARFKPDAVLHFAALSLVPQSMRDPLAYLGDNVASAVNLLRSVVRHGVSRFVLSSTASLFAPQQATPIDETASIDPGSPYGESKWTIERMLAWLDRIHGLRYAILRYFNAAGATKQRGEDHTPETHLIPLVLQVASGLAAQVTIFGDDYDTPDGTCVRDYVHVADLANAHLLALQVLQARSCVYNLGNGRGFSVQEVIQTARQVTKKNIAVEIGPRRLGDPPFLVAKSDAIVQELRWQPRHASLRDIVESAWRWHQANPKGYRGV